MLLSFLNAQLFRSVCKLLCAIALLSAVLLSQPAVARASVHAYPEGGEQVMWRSLQTLRDRSNQAWQVIFYKRVSAGAVQALNLRLVGFPDQGELAHPQPLAIASGTGKTWTAAEAHTTPGLPANVGEFDLRALMADVTADIPLELTIALRHQRSAKLTVPPFVVREWRQVVDQP